MVLTDREVKIGREADCEIRVPSNDVSDQHCVLRAAGNECFVRDLGSESGTFVNNLRIADETPLRVGDVLRVGLMVFEVAEDTPNQESTTPQPRKQAAGGGTTDDEIVDWLLSGESSPSDEAHSHDSSTGPETPSSTQPADRTSDPSISGRRRFKSIAEEGADIIRRHWEAVRREQEQGS